MTVSQAWPLQQAIFAVVSAAAPGIAVMDHAPVDPPEEFIRLDGFGIDDESMKNGERARHVFEVHHFLRPTNGTTISRGQKRGKQVIATVHTALMSGLILGQPLDHETTSAASDTDGVTVHIRSRYSVHL